jgi:hypothetical protein
VAGVEAWLKPQTTQAIASKGDFDFPDPKEPRTVIVPTEVAAYCYLYEALLWVALQRHPLYSQWEDSGDVRLDTEDIEGIDPRISFQPFTDDECDRAGLPRDPEYAAWNEGDGPPLDPQSIREIARLLSGDERQEILSGLAKAEAYALVVEGWNEQCDAFLDLPKSKLHIALREGILAAYGKRVPKEHAESFPEPLSHEEWVSWTRERWQVIAPNNWLSSRIRWKDCRLSGVEAEYALILVSTEQLMEAFPPSMERVGDAVRVGDGFLIVGGVAVSRSGKRGRPAYDWDTFHLQMARAFSLKRESGGIPKRGEE